MLSREQKAKIVDELQDRFRRQAVSIFIDFRGISVAKLTQFRRELKRISAELKIAKKTLLRRALEAVGIELEPQKLTGEIGVIFGYEDQIAPAKLAAKFAKENETFRILRGLFKGRILEAQEMLALARLPGREQLLGNLAGALQNPIQDLVNVLQGNIRNLVVILNQIKSKRD